MIAHSKFLAVEILSKNRLLVRKFSSKNAKVGAKNSTLGKFTGKIGILSTHRVLCVQFATVCRNSIGNSYLTLDICSVC